MAFGYRWDMADKERSGLSTLDAVLVIGGGIIAVVVAFAVLNFVAGILWFLFKVVVVVAVVAGIAWFLLRRD